MSSDGRLDDLLLRWEELREQGRELTAAELCRDCPELAGELQRRIDALRELDWLSESASSSMPSPFLVQPPRLATRNGHQVSGYRLIRRLGRGGFGEVWEAVGSDGSPVALKLVPWSEKAAAFEWRALEALKGIHHPHLVPVYGSWQTDDLLLIAMQLADRTILDRWQEAREQGSLGIPREELLVYFRQAADAIDYLHGLSIQHRDIKPQNLLLIGKQVKVADFGLARVLGHSVTGHTGSLTVAYAAPEFFDGKTAKQSDQYSLAVTYCYLRCGRLPFQGTSAQMLAGHLNRRPDLSLLSPEERPALARAMSKQPAERWPSCTEFVNALAAGEPSPWMRAGLRGQINKGMYSLLLLLVCVIVVAPLVAWLKGPSVESTPEANKAQNKPDVMMRQFETPEGASLVWSVSAVGKEQPLNKPVIFANTSAGPILWEIESGRVNKQLSPNPGKAVIIAPLQIGKFIGAVGTLKGDVQVFDLVSGDELKHFHAHDGSIEGISFSVDGAQLLTGSTDKAVRLWKWQTGELIQDCYGHSGHVSSVSFNTPNDKAVSASLDGTVGLWNLKTGRIAHRFTAHTAQVNSVTVSGDGSRLLTASWDRTMRVFDLENYKELYKVESDAEHVNKAIFYKPDEIISLEGKCLLIRRLSNGEALYRSPELPSEANCVTVTPLNGKTHAVVGTNGDGVWLMGLPADSE